MSDIGLESVLRRDRLVTAVALAVIVILAWAYVAWFAASMSMPMQEISPAASTDPGVSMDMDMPGMKMDMPGMDMGSPSPEVAGSPAIARGRRPSSRSSAQCGSP